MTDEHKFHFLKKPWKQRLLLIAGIASYVVCFQWVYVHWLYPVFGYFGFDYNLPSTRYLVLAWFLSIAPSFWMPLRLTRPSQLAYWVVYLTALIPSMFVPLYAGLNELSEIAALMLALFAGFVIVGLGYLLPLARVKFNGLSSSMFWTAFGLLAGMLALWVLVAFRGRLNIVAFTEIYDLRFAADTLIEGSNLNYALMWLSDAINPFLMGWGLYHKRARLFLLGVLGQLLVYASLGTKGSILSVPFVLVFYFVLRKERVSFPVKLTWGVVALFVGLCVTYALTGENMGPLHHMVLFLVFMRTFSINGLMSAQYYDFFHRNQFTHYSHIKGVSWFVNYPYANPLGIEVGTFYSGDPELDSTAHFWAMDGLAAWGLAGVLLISVFCLLVFWVLDSAAMRHNPRLSALVSFYAAYNIANISIFTSLLSGGMAVLMLLLYLMPRGPSEQPLPARVLTPTGEGAT